VVGARVTVLVPVKGRPLHILRLLWHSNRMKVGQRFLIADGSGHPELIALLKRSHQIFPDLEIEHVVYDDDGSLGGFYRRTADAARRATTPYVMNCGDDDLIFSAGLAPCVAFLDNRPDYVSCGGVVAGFSLGAGLPSGKLPVTGQLTALKFPAGRYYLPRDINRESALERLSAGYADYLSSYHNVFRSELLREIYDEIERQDFSILHFRESYQAMRTLVAGKIRTDPAVVHFFRQRRIGEAAGGDLIRAAFHPPFAAEFDRMMSTLAATISGAGDVSREAAESGLRDAYSEFFRRKAAGSLGKTKLSRTAGDDRPAPHRKKTAGIPEGFFQRVAAGIEKAGKFGRRAKREPRSEAVELSPGNDMFAVLAQNGARKIYLSEFRREFEEAERTLQGDEFTRFLREHAPELTEAT
jgi:glycosyltransferase domain-containing protein